MGGVGQVRKGVASCIGGTTESLTPPCEEALSQQSQQAPGEKALLLGGGAAVTHIPQEREDSSLPTCPRLSTYHRCSCFCSGHLPGPLCQPHRARCPEGPAV